MKLRTASGTLIAATSKCLFACVMFCLLFSTTTLKAQKDITVRNSETAAPAPFPVTGCVYKWVNDNPAIGLAASGTGDIAAFTGINNGFNTVKANISVTTTPVPPRAYGYANGVLSILNLTTFTADDVVPVPNAVYMGLNPNGNELYALDSKNLNKLYVVSTATNKVLSIINLNLSLPPTPAALMMTPDGSKIYVFNTAATPLSLTLIHTDARSYEVFDLPTTNTTRSSSHHVAMSDDGKQIYISNDTPGKDVWIFDTQTNAVTSTITVTRPGELFPAAGSKKLYILTGDANKLYAYDLTTATLTQLPVGTPGYGVFPALSPDHKLIYAKVIDNVSSTSAIINTSNDNITKVDEKLSSGLIFNPNGQYYYSINSPNGDVTVMSTASNTVVVKIPINASDGGNTTLSSSYGQLSYDGSLLYITNNVQYTAIGSVPTGYSYVSVIDTKSNMVIDKISVGSVNLIKAISSGACNGTPVSFTITVNPDPAVLNVSGIIVALGSTYGTPSAAGVFTLSGNKIGGSVLVSAPADFEVSTDNVNFSSTVTVVAPVSGDVTATKIYVRLKATAKVGAYGGNITLSNNATEKLVPVPTSTITPAALTIKPDKATKTYGATLTSIPASTAFTSTGLKNGETIGAITIDYRSGVAAKDPAGTYPGSATPSAPTGGTFLASNYTFSPEPGDLTVTPAPLTITADDKSRLIDEDNPTLTFTYSGFVNGEGVSQLIGVPTVSTSATKTSPAGLYPITPTGGSAANYTMVYKAGTLTVVPKVITVSNTFTPNGDGINDTWDIKFIYLFPKCTVDIYNRAGNKLLHSVGYTAAWDGKYNGTNLPTGTYYYIVDLNNGTKPVAGSISIIR